MQRTGQFTYVDCAGTFLSYADRDWGDKKISSRLKQATQERRQVLEWTFVLKPLLALARSSYRK